MKSNVIPLHAEPGAVRAARAAVAALPQAKRAALYTMREVVLTYLGEGDALEEADPRLAQAHAELGEAMDEAICTLMGFKGFSLRDVPPE